MVDPSRRRRLTGPVLLILMAGPALAACGSGNSTSSPGSSSSTTTASSGSASTDSRKVAAGCRPVGDLATSKPQESKAPTPSPRTSRNRKAVIQTNCGAIAITLNGAKAPKAAANFAHLAQNGFFEKTLCHRLTTSGIYVLQCGDPTGTGSGGPGYSFGPVENAPRSNRYPAGTLAMARAGGQANSNGSQFFIVYQDSDIPADSAGGYTVFGRVTNGMDIVRKIAQGGLASNATAPADSISLEKVTVQ